MKIRVHYQIVEDVAEKIEVDDKFHELAENPEAYDLADEFFDTLYQEYNICDENILGIITEDGKDLAEEWL
jgi:hypothetical protein